MIKKTFWMIVMLMCGVGAGSAQVLRVGDLVTAQDGTQGIVYYLNPDGSGGWMVALFDASVGDCRWGTASNVPDLADQDPPYVQELLLDTAGYANTLKIRAYYQDNMPYAAGVVDFEHGWVLPSPAQLRMLYAQLPFVSPALVAAGGRDLFNYPYWSSAEASDNSAWALYLDDGYAGFFFKDTKSSTFRVRAVRSFTYPLYLWNTQEGSSSIVVMPNQTTDYSVTVRTGYASVGSAETTITTQTNFDTVLVETVCDSYTWNGITYTESGVHTVHYTAANGCDSVVTLQLVIGNTPEVTIVSTDSTICYGDSVTLQASSSPVYLVPAVSVGDILCTDGTIVKPSDFLASGKTAMGVVYYVDATGIHGWAVHLHDQAERVCWSNNTDYDVPGVSNVDNFHTANQYPDFSGYVATQSLWAAGDSIAYPAAHCVDFPNGWYLPDIGQLEILYTEMPMLTPSLQVAGGEPFPTNSSWYYWAATEADHENPGYAWHLESNGRVDYCNKAQFYYDYYSDFSGYSRVRSIRDF